ncbi:unnamed protein product [Meloidogyne enterolobii]|uniref:Uncharacterized protein n=1 Tax=Meloidogyne enterolobii TaxID=390850 RepID=A0ACB0Y5G6_MELEN
MGGASLGFFDHGWIETGRGNFENVKKVHIFGQRKSLFCFSLFFNLLGINQFIPSPLIINKP